MPIFVVWFTAPLETGAAVTQLGTGILTTIAGSNDDSVPSPNFAVMAIQGGIQGVSETSQALRDLEANNQMLATAYQNLASINATGGHCQGNPGPKCAVYRCLGGSRTGRTGISGKIGLT